MTTTAGKTMRAVHLAELGPASRYKFVDIPIPVPKDGQVLLRVKAFGLNRSEFWVRQKGSPPGAPNYKVPLPRVQGLEAAGIVEAAPGNETRFPKGAAAVFGFGGMGVFFDGSYAEYACISHECVQLVRPDAVEALGWTVLGAIPAMLQTAHGALNRNLKLQPGDSLLIRGGTTSVGMAAAALAKSMGATVVTTTRKNDEHTAQVLRETGANHVLVDDGQSLVPRIKELFPSGVTKALDFVGGSAIPDSIACLGPDGICCAVGLVGGDAMIPNFAPLGMIPIGRYLSGYAERTFNAAVCPVPEIIERLMAGSLKLPIGKTFKFDQLIQAHEFLESNAALGKIVVLI